MKRLFGLLIALIVICEASYSQQFKSLEECKSIQDTARFMKYFFVEKNLSLFKGKKVGLMYPLLEAMLPIEDVSLLETSPYIDPEAKSYTEGIRLEYQSREEILRRFRTNEPIFGFDIYFEDTHVEAYKVWQRIPKEKFGYNKELLPYVGDFIVKDIKVYLLNYDDKYLMKPNEE